MIQTIPGLHHVTAIAIDPQANIDFYTQVLGLRLVKDTVNFDDPSTYHFYYGDKSGNPGTILTFFPFVLAGRGRSGSDMVDTVTFAVPVKSLDGWIVRLADRGIDFDGPFTRFSRPMIEFRDPDGLRLEIAAVDGLERIDSAQTDRDVAQSIGGFGGVTLCVEAPERTIKLLTETFGYRQVAEDSGRRRFRAANAGGGTIGAELDVLCHPEAIHGRPGGGTVHHIAFRAHTDDEQHIWREKIVALGFNVTPVLDRQYFRSIYFREPGGILFEIATDPPGFAVDETADRLGTSLKLPPWLEPKRADIERRLPPVRLPGVGS
jgi:glyoxalase family protein